MTDYASELVATANAIAAPGKGILAADESTGTIGARFAPIGVENTEDNRRRYRQLLFETAGLGEFISGVICYEEALFQSTPGGKKFVDLMADQGMIPGIKVDLGVRPLFGTDGETVTQGITDLDKRCAKYYKQGARFAKWRAVLRISDSGCPSQLSIDENARTLARYATICQANVANRNTSNDGRFAINSGRGIIQGGGGALVDQHSDQARRHVGAEVVQPADLRLRCCGRWVAVGASEPGLQVAWVADLLERAVGVLLAEDGAELRVLPVARRTAFDRHQRDCRSRSARAARAAEHLDRRVSLALPRCPPVGNTAVQLVRCRASCQYSAKARH